MTNFRLFKMKEFAVNNYRFDSNDRKFAKQVENNVGKGEIGHYKQFSFPHSVFKRIILQTRNNKGLHGKGLKHGGKRGKCWYPAFSTFPTIFSTLSRREVLILATIDLLSVNSMNLVLSKKFVI